MAIEDFISGRGWDIDSAGASSELQVGDRVYIATFGNNAVYLMFERNGSRFMEGRAHYKPNTMGGTITGTLSVAATGSVTCLFVRLQFIGNLLDVSFSTSAAGSSPNGGGTSSGPGGN